MIEVRLNNTPIYRSANLKQAFKILKAIYLWKNRTKQNSHLQESPVLGQDYKASKHGVEVPFKFLTAAFIARKLK